MDDLARYRAKRNFGITTEPRGGRGQFHGKEPIFVVQRHHASHLHYDFRLELDGTLKSWAIPKGPSLDPHDKRLAVHVEDHPISYATFEGTIPEKQYGAGEVVLWDRGTWSPEGNAAADYAAGKLKFELNGEKLHGRWTLVRTRLGRGKSADNGKENWLLIKERDGEARPAVEYDITRARPESVNAVAAAGKKAKRRMPETSSVKSAKPAARAPLPDQLAPQLATLVDAAPTGGDWIYELKLDGYRILTRFDARGRATPISRNGLDWRNRIPSLVRALEKLNLRNAWLDGEIVVLTKDGKPSFQLLQNAFADDTTAAIQYFLFDAIFIDGRDLRGEPWHARRTALEAALAGNDSPLIGITDPLPAPVAEIWSNVCHLGLEGLIGKQRDAIYQSGRGTSWIKLKCTKRQEFVIGGYTDPRGSRAGFGALLLGVHENGKLRYAGRVGTGFDEARLADMSKQLKARTIDEPPFDNPPTGYEAKGAHWVRPDLVGEVSFGEWTSEGLVRHAVFQGLRTDKPAAEIGVERAVHAPQVAMPKEAMRVARGRGGSGGSSSSGKKNDSRETSGGVLISHAARSIDASTGFTKFDLALYYESIAPYLLPHLDGRPVAMLRVPESIDGEKFFQKHLDRYTIPGAKTLTGLDPGHPPLVELDSARAVVGAAQMNVVELHTWNALATSIERPDRVIFDLDPDPALPWERMIEAVRLTHTLLTELGLESFLKTSGGKGLHVVVPLVRRHTWEAAKNFAQSVSIHLAHTLPDRFSAKSGPRNRIGKIFVDYLRNGRGATTVCAFSARARPGLPVSVTLDWKDLEWLERSDQWNIASVRDYLDNRKTDPWRDYEKSRQPLTEAIRRLGR